MRRPVALPAPWTAFVAARLGVFALALPPVAVAFAFIGWVSDKGLIAALGGAALVALAALAFAALAFLRIWQSGSQGLGSVISGSLAAGLVLAIPLLAGILFLMIPAVPDLSTDLRSPARFDALADDPAPLRLDEDGAGYDQRIMMLDGNFRTLFIDRPAWHVHEVLTGFAEEQGWQIVSNRAPAGRSAGRIEFIIPSWVPLMQRRGFTEREIEALLVETPRRLLAYL